jgi:nucleotide-binding universal stress UspA family protein
VEWRINPRGDAEAVVKQSAANVTERDRSQPGIHAREGDPADVPIRVADEGDPADVLIRVADELDAQLIDVGNKGMGRGSRFLIGSVSNKVSHHARCNVLIEHTTEQPA